MKKIVLIDRDGVINVDPIGDYVKSWEEFRFEKGVLEALEQISRLGYEIIIISNQAGVGDGIYSEEVLWDIHAKMMQEFQKRGIRVIDAYYCLHGKAAGCGCRKPETGLFEQAMKDHPFDRASTYFIGDKASDVEAGKRFGLKTIFVKTGHGQRDEEKLQGALQPDHTADNLLAAVQYLAQ